MPDPITPCTCITANDRAVCVGWCRDRAPDDPKPPAASADRKPTRRDLLIVIARLQGLIGNAAAIATNDRDSDRTARVAKALGSAHDLCIETLAHDPPITLKEGPL